MSEAAVQKKKKRSFPIAAIIAICLVVLILLAAGGYYYSYTRADAFASEGDLGSARQWLILPELTKKHDAELLDYLDARDILAAGDYAAAAQAFAKLGNYKDSADAVPEAEYALAGEYMKAEDYAAAIELYSALGDFQQSGERLPEARFGLGLQMLEEDNDPAGAHDIFAQLEQEGYGGAGEARQECVHRMVLELMEQGELVQAHEKLGGIPAHPEADQTMEELTELMYLAGQQAYREGRHGNAVEYFQLLGEYKDSQLYLPLIQLDSDYGYSVIQFSEHGLYSDEELCAVLRENLDFENAKELIVSDHSVTMCFLDGRWKSESGWYFFNLNLTDFYYQHNLPRAKQARGYLHFGDGKIYSSINSEDSEYVLQYTLTVFDENCVGFYCHGNDSVIILYRQ